MNLKVFLFAVLGFISCIQAPPKGLRRYSNTSESESVSGSPVCFSDSSYCLSPKPFVRNDPCVDTMESSASPASVAALKDFSSLIKPVGSKDCAMMLLRLAKSLECMPDNKFRLEEVCDFLREFYPLHLLDFAVLGSQACGSFSELLKLLEESEVILVDQIVTYLKLLVFYKYCCEGPVCFSGAQFEFLLPEYISFTESERIFVPGVVKKLRLELNALSGSFFEDLKLIYYTSDSPRLEFIECKFFDQLFSNQ